jgi:putative endonuclease
MSYCYIIYSERIDKFYIGACNGSLESRIEKHNLHSYGNQRYTASTNDWQLFLSIETVDYSHAIRLENKIKSMKSSIYIRNLKKYSELLQKIYNQTKEK